MKLTFWGTRGSIAKAGPTTLRYGGNTSCVELRTEAGTLIVIDCGTGAHGLGADLLARSPDEPSRGHLLISHTHWDHIQGLPFFAPLFRPESHWHVYGPRGLGSSLSETLAGQMEYSYFPVTLEQLSANVEYHDLVEGSFEIDDVRITTHYLNHPALTLGYRIEADGAVVVYASDHEPHRRDLAQGGDVGSSRQDRAHASFFAEADLLIHDAQYLASEYSTRVGWGHSTVEYVVDAARYAEVARLALYHHDPSRTDAQVEEIEHLARAHAEVGGYRGEVFAAAEGMTIELRGENNHEGSAFRSATDRPAMTDLRRGVLIGTLDPAMGATLTEAAEAEGLESWIVSTAADLLEYTRTKEPGIILLQQMVDPKGRAAVLDLARSVRQLHPSDGDDCCIVSINPVGFTPSSEHDLMMSDSMVWPASAVYVRTKLHAWSLRRACRWENAPLPADEERRLESLHSLDVLDTGPEERFDRLTELASHTFDVPIALVSLVDKNRQWFKSRHGIDTSETPRDMAFCSHAILDQQVMQVPDALTDSRFADNPLVAGDPRVRFYAGVPLTLSDGTRAGTFCVIDYRPRLLDEDQLVELRRLADLVTIELESR